MRTNICLSNWCHYFCSNIWASCCENQWHFGICRSIIYFYLLALFQLQRRLLMFSVLRGWKLHSTHFPECSYWRWGPVFSKLTQKLGRRKWAHQAEFIHWSEVTGFPCVGPEVIVLFIVCTLLSLQAAHLCGQTLYHKDSHEEHLFLAKSFKFKLIIFIIIWSRILFVCDFLIH